MLEAVELVHEGEEGGLVAVGTEDLVADLVDSNLEGQLFGDRFLEVGEEGLYLGS